MPGDYSRKTFNKKKHYNGVLLQQGRVQLDADWNEQLDIQLYRTRTEAKDTIGASGVPKKYGGFLLSPNMDGTDLVISPGRIYVEGLLCELEEGEKPVTYKKQPYYPNPDTDHFLNDFPDSPPSSPPQSPPDDTTLPLNLKDGTYIAYLEAWQQEINYHDDPLIQEVALGEADTSTRLQTVWKVKLLKVAHNGTIIPNCDTTFEEWKTETAPLTGKLNARCAPEEDAKNPCALPPSAGFSRLENQLYRVEIQKGGSLNDATFKWSRDNASIETKIEKIEANVLTVADIGKDEVRSFAKGQWVELVDASATLHVSPRALRKIDKVDLDKQEISLEEAFASGFTGSSLKLRRWDQTGETASENGVNMSSQWIGLEDGLQVSFSAGSYHSSDYWLIPARTATGEIEWPPYEIPNTKPVAQAPFGTPHYYCRLAMIQVQNGQAVLEDCRTLFPSLTTINAKDVTYDNTTCGFSTAKNVQEALDVLCLERNGCATYTAIPGFGWEAIFNHIGEGVHARICFQAGDYPLQRPVQINDKGHLLLSGCGPGTRIIAPNTEAALVFSHCQSVAIRDLYAETGLGARPQPSLNGTFTFIDCDDVSLAELSLKCGAGLVKDSTCITVRNELQSPTHGSGIVRIQNCNLNIGYLQQGILIVNASQVLAENNRLGVYPKPAALSNPQVLENERYRSAIRNVFVSNASLGREIRGVTNAALAYGNAAIYFRTHHSLRNAWRELLNDNPPQRIGKAEELLEHVKGLVNRLLLEVEFRKRYHVFAALCELILERKQVVASAGITVGGRIAGDVRILNNIIVDSLRGIHIGQSHANVRGTYDFADTVSISGNSIAVSVLPETAKEQRHGIFVGNCKNLIVENNNLTLERVDDTAHLAVDGTRVWGMLGDRLMITKNYTKSFSTGIRVVSLMEKPRTSQWVVMWNVSPSTVQSISVNNGVQAIRETNSP